MLGYGSGMAVSNSAYGEAPNGDFGMDEVECTGDEESLMSCRHNTYDDCGRSEAAGVICSGVTGR